MASFSQLVKNELARLETNEVEMVAELAALIRMNGTLHFSSSGYTLDVKTENAAVARRVYKLIKSKFNAESNIIVRRKMKLNKNNVYIIKINTKVNEILDALTIMTDEGLTNHPKEYIISDNETKRAYLRGCFLAKGSVNNPKTAKYHLEIKVLDEKHGEFVINILNDFRLKAKLLHRKKNYIVYIKEAEKISDFLRYCGANNGVLFYEDIRILRDYRNMTNRMNNCEQANENRIHASANEQIKNINIITEHMGVDLVDEKVRDVMEFRLKYPETSLTELAEIMTHETGVSISKSGLNHRFRKIKDLAKRIVENID